MVSGILPGKFAAKRLYRPNDLAQTLHRNPTFPVRVKRKPYIFALPRMPQVYFAYTPLACHVFPDGVIRQGGSAPTLWAVLLC